MRMKGRRQSDNVEDRRGGGGRKAVAGFGGLGVLVIAVIAILLGAEPEQVVQVVSQQMQAQQQSGSAPSSSPVQDELAVMISRVLADTEDTWNPIFNEQIGRPYQEPTLVLFSDSVSSACGRQSAAVGPFYCPADFKLYIDLTFYDQLARNYGAPGDFAQAYVVAHEVGHHVQNLLGVSAQVNDRQARARSQAEANEWSVKLELQADCLAGIWGHHADRERGLLDPSDVEEGLRAAAAIGDDTLQRRAGGRVQPESFTHGSSAERMEWFNLGLEHGRLDLCDTFS